MELENIILSEVIQVQKAKSCVFSHMWNIDQIQTQQYCEKQVTLKGDYVQESESESRLKVKKLNMVDILSI
jgi:hypothetical protein